MTTLSTDERRTLLLKLLAIESELLATSDGWLAWLKFAARFRTYSLNNQLLIHAQCPTATHVAGYRTWASLGRQVRGGERGIGIVAPLARRTHDEENPDDTRVVLTGFRIVHVFDIAQTDGDPIPLPEFPAVRVPDLAIREQLIIAAKAAGLVVRFVPNTGSGVRGWYGLESKTISLVEGYTPDSQVRTLLHELAHACDPAIAKPGWVRAERELVAESAAYLVAAELGIDISATSAHYVTGWGANLKTLLALAEESLAVAKMVDELTAELALPGLQVR